MIDAEIQDGQITKRYIFINLRAVALIEYDNEQHNGSYSDSASGNKNAGYSQNNAQVGVKIYAIHTDHLGTPLAITDSTQALVWRSEYATFGKATVQARVLESEGKTAENKKTKNNFGIISTANASEGAASGTKAAKPFEFNLRFAGQYEDTESGYHYNWHRYYDPSTGRYLTPDPIGLAGGLNGYGYAGQDPMGAVDPTGLKCLTEGNSVTCANPDPGGPNITFPKPPNTGIFNWPDSIDPSNNLYHKYDMPSSQSVGNCTSADLMPGIIKNPTPGIFTRPATKEGTLNSATPDDVQVGLVDLLPIPLKPLVFAANPVISYIIEDNDRKGTFWVVNVTQPGHSLFPGYVARNADVGADGLLHNYGEGTSYLQSPNSPQIVKDYINGGWKGMSDKVIKNCGCK